MANMRARSKRTRAPTLFEQVQVEREPPDFNSLLQKPLVDIQLPRDLDWKSETEHLQSLWKIVRPLQRYRFEAFVHAGGSGMVFKVLEEKSDTPRALKIVRRKVFHEEAKSEEVAKALSPVSEAELRALDRISHPNVVHLYEVIQAGDKGVGQ